MNELSHARLTGVGADAPLDEREVEFEGGDVVHMMPAMKHNFMSD